MDVTIARYIVGLISKDLDNRRPKGMKDCSSLELEHIENLLKDANSAKMIDIEKWIKDKLVAISKNIVNSTPPVENESKPASAVRINPNIIPADELSHNKDIYDIYPLVVQEIMCAIKVAASKGHNKLHFAIGERCISVFQLGQDFTNAGYKVSAVIGNDKSSTIDIEW